MSNKSSFDTSQLENFPQTFGVYLMMDKRQEIIYIGKANNLRSRVKQYFLPGRDKRLMIPWLTAKVHEIRFVLVPSEKEALLLESTLIKKHKPRYNALLKDDKAYVSLKITTSHTWPMIQIVRLKGKMPKQDTYFGPYISAYAARQTLEIMRRVFPLRQCSDRELVSRSRPCILHQMKRCVAPCVHLCSKESYDAIVKRAAQFLKGRDKEVIKSLKHEMELASEALEYERAGSILETIKQIEKTLQAQNIEKIHRGNVDAIGWHKEGDEITLTRLYFRGGKLLGSHHYSFCHIAETDESLLDSFLLQAYSQMPQMPDEILLPTPLPNARLIAELLSHQHPLKISTPLRGEKQALVEMASVNAKAAFFQEKDIKVIRERLLIDLQERLHLSNFPRRIECFDNSHISGSGAVAACVVFEEGVKQPRQYRKYILKNAAAADDYGAMREVLQRRLRSAKDGADLPDLFILDGGKGQLSCAMRVLQECNITTIDVIALAKEEGRHDKGATLERVFLPHIKDPITFKANSPSLHFLQQVRDEAHRFAITFQHARRQKTTFKTALEGIYGIGPIKRKRLLLHFGSVKRIKQASKEELLQVEGIGAVDIKRIENWKKSAQ